MAETAPSQVLDPALRPVPANAPVSPAGPNGIDPELVERLAGTAADQGAMLRSLVYDRDNQNGVPDGESRTLAKQYLENVRHRSKDDPSDPTPGRGTYYDRDGNQLNTNMVEEIMLAANPEGWVLGPAQSDILRTARNILANARPGTPIRPADKPILEAARRLTLRHMEASDTGIDADILQRMLENDAAARDELRRKPDQIHELEAQSDAYLKRVLPTRRGQAAGHAPVLSVGEAFPGANERVLRPEELRPGVDIHGRAVSGRAPVDVRGGYVTPAEGILDAETVNRLSESGMFKYLLSQKSINTAEDIARALYPNKVFGGSHVHGITMRGRGQSNRSRRLEQALTTEEDRIVTGFANRLEVVRGREAAIPLEVKEGVAEPTFEQLASELFPGGEDINSLTPQQTLIVRNTLWRLRDMRMDQTVRRDRFVRTQIVAGRGAKKVSEVVKTAREALKQESLKDRVRRRVGAAAMRGAMALGRAIGNVQGTYIVAKRRVQEAIQPGEPRARVGRMMGAVATGGQAAFNRLRNVEWGDAVLRVSTMLHDTAAGALSGVQAYAQERVQAFRDMDRGERNVQIGTVAAAMAMAGTVAVLAYLQQRHGAELPTGGWGRHLPNQALDHLPANGNHQHVNPADHLPTGNGGHPGTNPTDHLPKGTGKHAPGTETNSGNNSMNPNTNGATPNNVHEVVRVGKSNSHVRVQGYPEGSAGYRILVSAQQRGLHVDHAHANRLIDATLKLNKIGWDQKLGDEYPITLLTTDQMKQLLGD